MKRSNSEFELFDEDLVRPTKIMKLSNSRQCQSFELDLSGSVEHNVQLLTGLSPFYANVVSLNLAFCNYVSGTDVLTLLSSQEELLSNLKILNLSHTPITDSVIQLLVTKTPKLTSIDLSGCHDISDVSLSLLAQNCKGLQHLKVSGCPKIGDMGVQLVAQESKHHLRTLHVNDCPRITDKTLLYLGYYCENLSCLRLKNTRVSAGVLAKLLSTRLRLTELNVHGISSITDAFLSVVCKYQRTLRVFDVSFCYHVSQNGIYKVMQELDFLQEFHLFGLTLPLKDLEDSRPPALSLFF